MSSNCWPLVPVQPASSRTCRQVGRPVTALPRPLALQASV
jgi:hypothetical protein